MSSPAYALLKEEICKTQEAQHDLAKWKLGVTAALGAAAMGLPTGKSNYLLLFFVPFVCAYVDLYAYQYQLRILAIARFLRKPPGEPVLLAYEDHCLAMRDTSAFSFGNLAGIGSSAGATLFGALLYFLAPTPKGEPDTRLLSPQIAWIVWIAGALLILSLNWYYQHVAGVMDSSEAQSKR